MQKTNVVESEVCSQTSNALTMSFLLNHDRYTKVCTLNTYNSESLRYVYTWVRQTSPYAPTYLSCPKHPWTHIDISFQICLTYFIYCYYFLGLRTFNMNSCFLSTLWAYHHSLLQLPNSMAMWCGPVGPRHSKQPRHGIFCLTLPHSFSKTHPFPWFSLF